jgi:hypothetical protein
MAKKANKPQIVEDIVNEPEVIEVTEVKPIEVAKVEVKVDDARSADDIYRFICELHEDSEKLQMKAAMQGLTPTNLQVISNQLRICKSNIARALDK